MIDNITAVDMPTRSRLFNLAMIGACGATQESLLSYSRRLCAAHHVPARQMMAELLLPESGMASLTTKQNGHSLINPKNVISLNGASDGAATFAAGMIKLTGNPKLGDGTFLHWRGLLSSNIAMAPSCRWCPRCLAGQSAREHSSYSLLWSVKAVVACPIHRTLLLDRCVHCEKPQPLLGDGPTHGRCQHCCTRLGSDSHCDSTQPAAHRQQFMAESAAEMIGLASSAMHIATREGFHEQLRHIARTHFGGSVRTLERRLHLSAGVLSGGGAVTLPVLLDLSCSLGLKPVDMLKGGPKQVKATDVPKSERTVRRRMSPSQIQKLQVEVNAAVRELIQASVGCIVVAHLAERFQVRSQSLYAHCADTIALIQDYNTRTWPRMQAKKLAQLELAATSAMRNMVADGGIVTKRRINQALVDAGVHWSRAEARAAASQELANLLRKAA